jgi:hypothetical protein
MTQRTNQPLWEHIKQQVTAAEVAGTHAGQWSARKAQLAVKLYKENGGEYIGKKTPNSLTHWTEQHWTTKSGLPSHITGERYLPREAIEHLTPREYNKTSKAKREATELGYQYSKQPTYIANKTKQYRM